MTKKLLSVILSLVLIVSLIPISASADGADCTFTLGNGDSVTVKVGDTVDIPIKAEITGDRLILAMNAAFSISGGDFQFGKVKHNLATSPSFNVSTGKLGIMSEEGVELGDDLIIVTIPVTVGSNTYDGTYSMNMDVTTLRDSNRNNIIANGIIDVIPINIVVTGNPKPITSIEIAKGTESVTSVDVDGTTGASLTAKALADSTPVTNDITWTIAYPVGTTEPTDDAKKVEIINGSISVGPKAPAGKYVITATQTSITPNVKLTKDLTVTHNETPALSVIDCANVVTVPGSLNIKLLDQYGDPFDGATPTLTPATYTENTMYKIEASGNKGEYTLTFNADALSVTLAPITLTSGSIKAENISVVPADVSLSSVAMDKSTYQVKENDTVEVTATVKGKVNDVTPETIISVADADVTFTLSGTAAQFSNGTNTITAKTDANGQATCTIKGVKANKTAVDLTVSASKTGSGDPVNTSAKVTVIDKDPAPDGSYVVTAGPDGEAPADTKITVTYNGSVQNVTVGPKSGVTGLGAVTEVKYLDADGKEAEPKNAGTYNIYAYVEKSGDVYAAGTYDTGYQLVIEKADRMLTTDSAPVLLTDESNSAEVKINGFTTDPADSKDTLSLNDRSSIASVSFSDNSITLTGVKSGTEAIQIGSAESVNYKAATAATVDVTVIMNPVVNATATESGAEKSNLTVSVDNTATPKTIYVMGTVVAAGAAIQVVPEYDATIKSSLADAEPLSINQGDDSKDYEVKLSNGTVASKYVVDVSGVVVKDAKVTVNEEPTDVTTPDDASLSSIDYTTGETKVEGVANADYTYLLNIGKDASSNEVTVTVTPTIAPTSYNASAGTMSIDISFTYTVKDKDGNAIAGKTGTIDEFNRPVLVSVQIPTDFKPAVAKNTHNNKTSYMAVTITAGAGDGYSIASWWQSKFSATTLEADLAGSITFVENNQTIPYNKLSLNDPEFDPAEGAPAGKKYDSWDIYIDDVLKYPAVKALDDKILEAIDGKNVIAKANWSDAGSSFIPSSSGSSSSGPDVTPMYKLNNTVSTNGHGTVSLSDTITYAGRTVTLNVKPDEGYKLGSLNVTDAKGNKIAVTEKDGKYTFTMPASNINVSATFVQGDASAPATPGAKINFSDVPANQWYSDPVAWAVEKDITNGMGTDSLGNQLFEPFSNCTRAQFVTFLWRAAGKPVASATSAFSDVAAGSYYENAVRWAVANGITNGKAEGLFMPNDLVTRAEAVTFLCRALKGSGSADSSSFTDVPTGTWYTAAVDWAIRNQITDGMGNNLFQPGTSLNRAMAVTFLQRAYK